MAGNDHVIKASRTYDISPVRHPELGYMAYHNPVAIDKSYETCPLLSVA